MKLFFPLIIYILREIRFRDIRGGSEGLGAEKGEEGEGRIFRRLEAVLLNLTMKYNFCHQRSTTPVVNEVLLLQSMQYYSCLSDYLFGLGQRMLWGNPVKKDILAAPNGRHLHTRRGRSVN